MTDPTEYKRDSARKAAREWISETRQPVTDLALDKEQDAHFGHLDHALTCKVCQDIERENAEQCLRILRLSRKVRKWKRRAKAEPVAGTVAEWANQGVPGPGSRVYKEWMHDAEKSPAD